MNRRALFTFLAVSPIGAVVAIAQAKTSVALSLPPENNYTFITDLGERSLAMRELHVDRIVMGEFEIVHAKRADVASLDIRHFLSLGAPHGEIFSADIYKAGPRHGPTEIYRPWPEPELEVMPWSEQELEIVQSAPAPSRVSRWGSLDKGV